MCLTNISPERSKKKFLKEARKRGYIRVWKVCDYRRTGWYFARSQPHQSGLQESNHQESSNIDYGWHGYLSFAKAKRIFEQGDYLMICYAKPSWLKGLSLATKHATFTHLVFPEWDKGNMTIREFRQICKGEIK